MRQMVKKGAFTFFLLVLLVSGGESFAQTQSSRIPPERIEAEAQVIADTMMSPFCPGRTISACPSPQARDLRGQISQWLSSGYSPEAVRKQLQTIYGEDVRGLPQETTFGQLGWWAPILFVVFALLAVWWELRRLRIVDEQARANKSETAQSIETEDKVTDKQHDAQLEERIEKQLRDRLM